MSDADGEGMNEMDAQLIQDNSTEAGQRRINLIWEATQASIAVVVTIGMLYLAIVGTTSETVTNAFFLIIGFYFSRTNHQNIGGVGDKPQQAYKGR